MSRYPRSNDDLSNDDLSDAQLSPLAIEDIELESFEDLEDIPIDDPGEAQRSSKSGQDGDGEEEMR